MTRDWLRTIEAAQDDRVVLYEGQVYLRIPYGQEQWWGWEAPPTESCRDCGCQPGQLHVTSCDVEECPICQPQQRLSCPHWWELRETLTPEQAQGDRTMAQSFFHLTPSNDDHVPHICADCAAEMAEEPEEVTRANMQAALALGNALLEALDAYTDAHEETTYRHMFEALAYMHWHLQRELDEEAADA